jgi:hypothetical protein
MMGNPKTEIRNPKEIRKPNSEAPFADATSWVRLSAFGFLSAFGLRISDFNPAPPAPTTTPL